MNRTGLWIALSVAIVAGSIFAIFPQLDIALARLFYDDASQRFLFGPSGFAQIARRGAMWIAWAFVVPAVVTPIVKLIRPHRPLLVPGRAAIFLLSTIFLTAIVLPNLIFKSHWGRPRPIAITEFNGTQTFRPWWDPRGTSSHNGSFFSGEAATAFWTYAPAALAPAPFRAAAFAGATIFGLTTGILRMAFGGHYASDVIAAGVTAFLVTWLMHGLIYRWNTWRLNDQQIDQAVTARIVRMKSTKLWLAAALAVLTLIRLVALRFSVVDLFPDEARYWVWAQTPAFGYASKPPLIAWIIAGAGRVFGSCEACLRAPAPLFYAATALVAYFIARHLYDERTGSWTGLSIALGTGAVYSARIISTDVPLLFFWAVALLAYVKLLRAPKSYWSLILGLAMGLGLLAKYAMIYFLFGVLAATLIDPAARTVWHHRGIWIASAIALILVSPNLVWNAQHDFVTFQHTKENITGNGLNLNLLEPLAFLGSQFGVCGPIVFATFVCILARPSLFRLERSDRILIAFALAPLLLVTIGALITSAKANWAAPSGIAITVVATAFLVRREQWRWLQASIVIGIAMQAILVTGDGFADRISLPFLAKPDIYHRTMGWKALSELVRTSARENVTRTIATDQNDVYASLRYYLRGESWPILSGPPESVAIKRFEPDRALTVAAAEPILYLSDYPDPKRLAENYSTVETLPPIDAPTGPRSARRIFAFKVSGAR